jgi:hypothetical protein
VSQGDALEIKAGFQLLLGLGFRVRPVLGLIPEPLLFAGHETVLERGSRRAAGTT